MKDYFAIQELVPEHIYKKRGEASIELLSPLLKPMLNSARIILDTPMTVNDWHVGGNYDQSGLRTWHEYATDEEMEHIMKVNDHVFFRVMQRYFDSFSQHKYGRAADNKIKGNVKDAIKELIRNHEKCPLITFIEIDRPWLHLDCRRNRDGAPLKLWSPDRDYVSIEDYLNS